MLDRGGIDLGCQRQEEGFPGQAVVRENPDLDQAVGVERGLDFLAYGRGQSVRADHDDRVKVMGLGAVFFALGGRELNLGHGPIIGLGFPNGGEAADRGRT